MGNRISELEAAQLRQRITDSGRSITNLTRAAKVPQPVLHRFVHGTRTLWYETAQKVAQVLGMDFVPVDVCEMAYAIHDFAWQSMLETEREALALAKSLRAAELRLRAAGDIKGAEVCSRAAYAQDRTAARAREYVEKRLKPARARVERELAKAKAKAEKTGRGRRSSKVKTVESN